MRGDALNGIVASKITSLLVQTEDKYGNHCHIGGDRVNLSMSGPNGIKVNALDVKDNEDGTYSFSFIVPQSDVGPFKPSSTGAWPRRAPPKSW